jgi:formylglycine-generating enzyme required for sulfatase activity
LVRSFLSGSALESLLAEREIRTRGLACVAGLRAAEEGANEGQRARIRKLLARLEVAWQREQTPEGMVYIPAGHLEVPRIKSPWGPSGKRVEVPAFYIDKTEVSVGAWRSYLAWRKERGDAEESLIGLWKPPVALDDELPAVRVRWTGASHFAEHYRKGRLPRAEEFERALRGSGVAPWPWGDAGPRGRANLLDLGPGEALPVGSHPSGASSFGVLNLVGNVAEWSSTEVKQGRVGRYPLVLGGSYLDRASPALSWRGRDRMSARTAASERRPDVGFRVVREVQPLP